MKPILDLKNDLVFKAVFSREEDPASKKLLILRPLPTVER